MQGSWQAWEIPNLNDQTGEIKSKATTRYNCIAWAVGITTQWWWPDRAALARKLCYWPPGAPIERTFDAFFQAYRTLGYQQCNDGSLEAGHEKIAIFGRDNAFGVLEPTHAALQLPDGRWTSKLGPHEDVEHIALDAIDGPTYGRAIHYMRRPRTAARSKKTSNATPDKKRAKRRQKAKAARTARKRSRH
jgi:hypothetical protein